MGAGTSCSCSKTSQVQQPLQQPKRKANQEINNGEIAYGADTVSAKSREILHGKDNDWKKAPTREDRLASGSARFFKYTANTAPKDELREAEEAILRDASKDEIDRVAAAAAARARDAIKTVGRVAMMGRPSMKMRSQQVRERITQLFEEKRHSMPEEEALEEATSGARKRWAHASKDIREGRSKAWKEELIHSHKLHHHHTDAWGPKEVDPTIAVLIDEVRKAGSLFEDPDFEPQAAEPFFPEKAVKEFSKLKGRFQRPDEWLKGNVLWDDGIVEHVVQGSKSRNCFFVAALTCLVAEPTLLQRRIVAAHPELGLYVVSFCLDGAWKQVVIDDRFAIVDGGPHKAASFLFAQSSHRDPQYTSKSIWPAVIEKAYAKMVGGYANMTHGSQSAAVQHLTGAAPLLGHSPAENPELFAEQNFLDMVQNFGFCDATCIVSACAPSLGASAMPKRPGVLPPLEGANVGDGIVSDHVYPLIKFIDRRMQKGGTLGLPLLLVMCNHWGKGKGTWTGRWSEKSSEWDTCDKNQQRFRNVRKHQGLFTISFADACRVFKAWDFTFIYPEDFYRLTIKDRWTAETAGGRLTRTYQNYLKNPCFRLIVPEPPLAEDGEPVTEFSGQLSLAATHSDDAVVGFEIFYACEGEPLTRADLVAREAKTGITSGYNEAIAEASMLIEALEPGEYHIVPSTFMEGVCCDFTMTLWSSYPARIHRQ